MGALGVAILSKGANTTGNKLNFDFNMKDIEFKVVGNECNGCSNNCEIVSVYKDGKIIDKIGGRCGKGNMVRNIV